MKEVRIRMSRSKTRPIKRFTKPIIFVHWLNAAAFFLLYLSGLPMYTDTFNFMYAVFGGPENARLLHRIGGIALLLPIVIILIFDPKGFFHWIKTIFTWSKRDIKFILAFPKEFFGRNPKVPKQDYYNGGEKINSLLIIVCTVILVGSGFVMWFPDAFPQTLVNWSYPLHNIGFGLAAVTVVGHIFLSIAHPNSKVSIEGMKSGNIPEWYAEEHHGQWYEDEVKPLLEEGGEPRLPWEKKQDKAKDEDKEEAKSSK